MASVPRQIVDVSSLELALETLQQRIDLLQQSLTQQQRLATLGMVTSVIAHEFNNILTPMISYTRCAMGDKADEALRTKALQKALAGAERLAGISESLLGFARGDESTTAQVKHAIEETLSCLSRDLSKDGITLTLEVPEDLCVGMNGGQLQQVLMNLIVNARTAMLERGPRLRRLTVRATTVKRGKIAQIEISDTGPGIAAEVLPRIFEPFFSTKGERGGGAGTGNTQRSGGVEAAVVGEEGGSEPVARGGTGLGLTICQELVAAAGGVLRVESEVNKGTTFYLEVPLAAGAKAA